jgi:hypothetical protein
MSSDPPGSDISEFAVWEAEHPSQAIEESERERSLADMGRPERMRVWADRDSSNDARSSDEEVEVKGKGGEIGLGKGKKEVLEILSSDAQSEGEGGEETGNEVSAGGMEKGDRKEVWNLANFWEYRNKWKRNTRRPIPASLGLRASPRMKMKPKMRLSIEMAKN